MASLWRPLRLLPPLQSTLSQSLGLRACTPLQSRLLHSSPIFYVRKPSKAVVKPIDGSAPTRKKQHKDALRKKQPADEKDEIERFNAESPTLIYEATKARQYVAWCLFASLLLGCVAAMQIGFFTTDPSKSDLRIASVFLLTALMWAILASWAAFGANDVIKKIWAIPSATGKPLLRIEPVKIALGKRPLPFDVPLGRVFSDKGFTETIAYFNATRDVRRKPGVLDALFGPVGTIMSANMKMIQRKSSFAQLRVADSGVWKVDLRDCKVPDGGKSMLFFTWYMRDHFTDNYL
ncbi:unnamed protein product [Aureobasidium vineae]|uniref:Uncharacterized protein n=1 Tax=Aureobasidium vineae TaxID=2773715 RepID=A0A9N8JW14_9PEZI|nr:unnamed protein product [Aureobasidium vineae]